MDLRLAERVALVTGASAGIGRAIALGLAGEGVQLVLAARRRARLDELAVEISALGGPTPIVAAMDLAISGAGQAVADVALSAFGRLDIAVFSAGIGTSVRGPRHEDAWAREIQVRLTGVRESVDTALPGMMKHRFGRIILIGGNLEPDKQSAQQADLDGCGIQSSPTGVANAGRLYWAKSLATQVGQYGITVNTLVPGRILGERIERIYPSQRSRDEYASCWIPAGYFGRPEDFAVLACFLASPLARYITGEVIHIDGGRRSYAF